MQYTDHGPSYCSSSSTKINHLLDLMRKGTCVKSEEESGKEREINEKGNNIPRSGSEGDDFIEL
jgi:hypothetical protein